jgi:hypothetical protein
VGRTGAVRHEEDSVVRSRATTVEEYLQGLPEERRAVLSKVRDVVRKNLPRGYRETMNWGMITYEIPLERYPDTYNGQPLCYAGLAAQKNYNALYLMGAYQDPDEAARLREALRKAGKKVDMGKSCLRFRRAEDLPLEIIGRLIKGTPPEKFIAWCESSRRSSRKIKPKRKTA